MALACSGCGIWQFHFGPNPKHFLYSSDCDEQRVLEAMCVVKTTSVCVVETASVCAVETTSVCVVETTSVCVVKTTSVCVVETVCGRDNVW